LLNLLVGVKDQLADGIIDQTGGWSEAELAFLSFFQLATQQTLAQPMEFCFAHGAFDYV
jgi:hypothetical protein